MISQKFLLTKVSPSLSEFSLKMKRYYQRDTIKDFFFSNTSSVAHHVLYNAKIVSY